MRALVYPDWETLVVDDVPQPSAGTGEILVQVAACGICGSELETFKARSIRRQPPLIMGHEFCGVVAEAGPETTRYKAGDRVVSNSVVHCRRCASCIRGDTHLCSNRQIFGMHRPGAFADYVVVPEYCLIDWPINLSATSACLAEPLANGVHVQNLVKHFHPQNVLVIGAGPIGLMCQQVQQLAGGPSVFVSDIIPERRNAAKALGAEVVLDPSSDDVVAEVRRLTAGNGVDLVIDAVGSETTKHASIAASRDGGAIVWIGLHGDKMTLDTYEITLSERAVLGSYAATIQELEAALVLMADGSVDVSSWVSTYSLDDGPMAFRKMLSADGIKAVLEISEQS